MLESSLNNSDLFRQIYYIKDTSSGFGDFDELDILGLKLNKLSVLFN